MADPTASLLALLGGGNTNSRGLSDLDQFQSILSGNNYYKAAAAPIMGARFDTSTWSPTAQILTPLLQAFTGSALNAYGQNQDASQLAQMAKILPSLYSDPINTAIPEGVDQEAGNMLKLKALKDIAVRGNETDKEKRSLFAEVFSRNPSLAIEKMPDMAERFGIAKEEAAPLKIEEESSAPPLFPSLMTGGPSTSEKFRQLYKENLSAGVPPVQAAAEARQRLDAERKANAGSFDLAKEAREKGQRMLELASTAQAGIEDAGQTGALNPLASIWENIAAYAGSEEANKNLLGDANLKSVSVDIANAKKFAGAMSDFELKQLLGAGPGPNQTPEVNREMADKMEQAGRLQVDYADFLESYRDLNNGNISGADKAWDTYKSAYPIMKKTKSGWEINKQRPSWREFFAEIGASGEDSSAPSVGGMFEGKKILSVRKIS